MADRFGLRWQSAEATPLFPVKPTRAESGVVLRFPQFKFILVPVEILGDVHGLEFVAFRYFNAAGATALRGEHHRVETHLTPNLLKVALMQKAHSEIFGTDYPTPDGTCIRDYIHVADIAQAHVLALTPGKKGFYNLGKGEGYSVREVITACEEICGRIIPTVNKPRRMGDPPRLVASSEKAMIELAWRPQFPKLHQIVSTAWEWHCRHPFGYQDSVNAHRRAFAEIRGVSESLQVSV